MTHAVQALQHALTHYPIFRRNQPAEVFRNSWQVIDLFKASLRHRLKVIGEALAVATTVSGR